MTESQFFIILANVWLASCDSYFGFAIGLFYLLLGVVIGLSK